MIELLAPAGSREALTAAVESGVDAVYLAGKRFGARASADNFTDEELREAIAFAHRRDVLVDVAVNTLVDDAEFAELASYLCFLYKAGADAIIVQDLGVARLARRVTPNLALHASTQLTVHNLEGVQKLKELGFTRVVLARELSMEEICWICKSTDVEIEIFIHGALCICYSGQCLMSSMIGGRSGNRGRCAQPCRLPYTLIDEDGADILTKSGAGSYLLSPKDMNTIEMIGEFIDAGAASLKIEGRMKRPEYVAVVVDAYRRAIDRYRLCSKNWNVSAEDTKNLAQIFNRDFTTAYLKGRTGKNMMSDRRPNNRGVLLGRTMKFDAEKKRVTLKLTEPLRKGDIVEFWVKVGGRVSATAGDLIVDGQITCEAATGQEVSFVVPGRVQAGDRAFKVFDAALMERARSFYSKGTIVRRIPVDFTVEAAIGEPLRVTVRDEIGNRGVGETKTAGQPAMKRPLSEESVRKQLSRLGTTVYELRKLTCDIRGEIMVPVSEINEARRNALDALEARRLEKFHRPPLPADDKSWLRRLHAARASRYCTMELKVSAVTDTVEKAAAALENGADIVYFGGESFEHRMLSTKDYHKAYELARAHGRQLYFCLPRIIRRPHIPEVRELLQSFAAMRPDGIAVSNIAAAKLARDALGVPLHVDLYANLYNTFALDAWKDLGAESFTLSPELNFGQIERIASASDEELECMVHGNLTLMVSEYCVLGSFLGGLDKGNCTQPCQKGRFYLLDRKKERFPVVTDQFCHMHILNGKETSMYSHVQRLQETGIARLRIEGRWMTASHLGRVVRLYKELIALGGDHPLLARNQLETVEGVGITRGHFFRGVL